MIAVKNFSLPGAGDMNKTEQKNRDVIDSRLSLSQIDFF
jgi:hypothetical protein